MFGMSDKLLTEDELKIIRKTMEETEAKKKKQEYIEALPIRSFIHSESIVISPSYFLLFVKANNLLQVLPWIFHVSQKL